MSDLPFVTCLCLTKGRREWLSGALESFVKQDYRGESDLLVVADDWEDLVQGGLQENGLQSLYGIHEIQKRQGFSVIVKPVGVGRKRNLGCCVGRGSFIAIWDDDDYSAPGRLTQQVETLLSTGKAVTGYTGLKFTDGKEWWRFLYSPIVTCPLPLSISWEYVHATSLCFRRDWWKDHRFEELQVGQDERFALAASAADQLAPCPDLDLMYATIHPGNTSPRVRINGSLVGSNWEPLPGYQSPHPSVFPFSVIP